LATAVDPIPRSAPPDSPAPRSSRSSSSRGSPARSSSASTSRHVPPGDAPAAGSKVVWFSLDPRTGEVTAYPEAVNRRLEGVYLAGGDREVLLAGLGGVFESIIVDLGSSDQQPSQLNPLTGGRRDVRRLLVPDGTPTTVVHIIKARGWRLAEFPVSDLTEERMLRILQDASPVAGSVGRAGSWRAGGCFDPVADKEARLAAARACDQAGLVGLWEWCRTLDYDPASVAADMWGNYGDEQDAVIEAAYRAGAPNVQISVGIRNYEIQFRGASGGRQEDKAMRKRRLIRRRAVTKEQRATSLEGPTAETNENPELADQECAICCIPFAETAAVPVVRLPECGHVFHGACIQHIADRQGTCPFCRAQVDWVTALTPQARVLAPPTPSMTNCCGAVYMDQV